MQTTRRKFLAQTGLGLSVLSTLPGIYAGEEKQSPVLPVFKPGERPRIDSQERRFHLSVRCSEVVNPTLQENGYPMGPNPKAIKMNATSMAELWKEAGVTDIWIAPYGSGTWREADIFDDSLRRIQELGMTPHFITVPLGHPFVNLDELESRGWKKVHRFTGEVHWGVSCHEQAAKECVDSIRRIADLYGPCDVFLDDDFRFANSPADVGGCVCPECKADFMQKTGFSEAKWDELIGDLKEHRDTKAVRVWVDYFCDRLTKVFRDSEAIAPEVDLGIMVMGMGSEKAGIRLEDYRDKLFRVGEWMFSNSQYDSTKNKTIELYSSLFHRRFVSPGRAFSETTIIQELSAENYVSKLTISTLSNVRNTMFMCPIPASYWSLIAPRMKREAEYHSHILTQKAKGPFKHFWGIADRYMYSYDAYSLFLAIGVPFEVCDELPSDGWSFLGDASAAEMERGELTSPGTRCIARSDSATGRFTKVEETFDELFKFRRTLLEEFRSKEIPYIEEETPVVLGWYPDAHAMLLWNVEKTDKTVHIRQGNQTVAVPLASLDSAMVLENTDGTFRVI